jgi:hypothetical protein
MINTPTLSVTINGITAVQFDAITKILDGSGEQKTTPAETTTKTRKTKTRTTPENTVSEDEEESFAEKELDEDELDDDDLETTVSFATLKRAINTYGEKNPDRMKAILLGFNMKTTKELEKHPSKWDAVYTKVMARLNKN